MRTFFPLVLRISLAVFLLISSGAILYSTYRNNESAQLLADQSLQSLALALASSAENVLREGGSKTGPEIRDIFSDRVVAYALIAGRDGTIHFHTNPALAGSKLAEDDQAWPAKAPAGRRIILGTGTPAYEFNSAIHRPDGGTEWLRLVIHTYPADRIVSDARRMWWTVGVVLILLWSLGILAERIFSRHLRLREDLERKEQLALIGQMTAVLAHEIRNALASIKGYAQWVDEKIDPGDPKKTGLAAVLRGTGRIESLVNDLLFFSRAETFDLERVDPATVVKEAIESTCSSWEGNIQLNVSAESPVLADREKLHRVLANVIRNGVEAMGDQGTLGISVRREGRWVSMMVEDTGTGIPESEIPRLFTPFHTTKTDGTGLGLAYSKKVIEGMGGRINLVNREKTAGAVLTIQLRRGGKYLS